MTALPPDRHRPGVVADRFLVAALFALTGGLVAYWTQMVMHGDGGDLVVTWRAVQFLMAGQNPYEAVRPFVGWARDAYWFYPMPAALLAVPVAWLRPTVAAVVFVSGTSGLLGYALHRAGRPWFPVLISVPFWYCAVLSQMAAAILAFALLPAVAWLTFIKPNLAIPLFAWRPSWRAAIAAAFLFIVSVVLYPYWPVSWYHALAHSTTHSAPIMRPLGFVGLASLLRWRRPEARLLALLTIAPASLCFYDELVLFLVASSSREAMALCATGWLAWAATLLSSASDPAGAMLSHAGPWIIIGLYLPATIMVVRRPNEGRVPRWLEETASHFPGWLRGRPTVTPLAVGPARFVKPEASA